MPRTPSSSVNPDAPETAPSVYSLAPLVAADPLELSPEERLDLLVQLERHANWLEAVRLATVAAVSGPGPDFCDIDPVVASGDPLAGVASVEDSIRDEVASALRVSGRSADRRIALARDLEHKLPRTRDLLRSGDCSYLHASMISEECVELSIKQARRVESDALDNVRRQTPSQTRRCVRRAVARVRPKSPEDAVEEEFARRDVQMYHDGGVMATIMATVPAPDAMLIWNALTATAHKNDDPDDSRTRAHKRADALIDWAQRAGDDPDLPVMQGKKRLETQVVIDAATLLGLAEEPGELVGYGPIPSHLARLLAADSQCWRRMVTDPVTGHLLDYGHRTYKPPADLREYVIARDRGCQFPGCSQPAQRCDLDHVEPFTGAAEGGATSADNLLSLCRRHHKLKTHHRWRVRIVRPADEPPDSLPDEGNGHEPDDELVEGSTEDSAQNSVPARAPATNSVPARAPATNSVDLPDQVNGGAAEAIGRVDSGSAQIIEWISPRGRRTYQPRPAQLEATRSTGGPHDSSADALRPCQTEPAEIPESKPELTELELTELEPTRLEHELFAAVG